MRHRQAAAWCRRCARGAPWRSATSPGPAGSPASPLSRHALFFRPRSAALAVGPSQSESRLAVAHRPLALGQCGGRRTFPAPEGPEGVGAAVQDVWVRPRAAVGRHLQAEAPPRRWHLQRSLTAVSLTATLPRGLTTSSRRAPTELSLLSHPSMRSSSGVKTGRDTGGPASGVARL